MKGDRNATFDPDLPARAVPGDRRAGLGPAVAGRADRGPLEPLDGGARPDPGRSHRQVLPVADVDRKSTRLNSSHLVISYAVFCLKKKKNTPDNVAERYG